MGEIPNTLTENEINSIVRGKETLDKPDREVPELTEVQKDVETLIVQNENLKTALELLDIAKQNERSKNEGLTTNDIKKIFTE